MRTTKFVCKLFCLDYIFNYKNVLWTGQIVRQIHLESAGLDSIIIENVAFFTSDRESDFHKIWFEL